MGHIGCLHHRRTARGHRRVAPAEGAPQPQRSRFAASGGKLIHHIYFKMKRPNATGLRRIFWLAAAAMLALPARADSPFYTDDTNFSPGREIKMGFTGEHNSGSDAFNEVLDWNYAVVPNVRLNLTTYSSSQSR